MERVSTIKPGYLISLSVSVRGGVAYSRVDLATEIEAGEERKVERWETTKVVQDPEEYERARKVQSTCGSIIRRVCIPFGRGGAMICPLANEAQLDEAVKRARTLAAEFKATSSGVTSVDVYLLKGKIASTDEEAARAIGEEVKSLIDAMSDGIDAMDPKAIRDAADRARKLGTVLDATQEIAVSEAIKQARKAARTIVSRVEKKAEDSALVLKDIQRGSIEKARLAFLDLDPVQAVSTEALPAVDVSRFAELDLDSHDAEAPEESAPESACESEPETVAASA
jgi:hypothetical protein